MRRALLACMAGISIPLLLWLIGIVGLTSSIMLIRRAAIVPYMSVWGFYYLLEYVFPPPKCTLCLSLPALALCLVADFITYALVGYVLTGGLKLRGKNNTGVQRLDLSA